MIDKDIKIKYLEFELESRQTQKQKQKLQRHQLIKMHIYYFLNKIFILELQEKIKMLEIQNLKFVEKNQNDVVEWKTKERKFKIQVTSKIKTTQSSLKSTIELAGYFKGRLKKLDIENQELLDTKIRLESLIQEFLERNIQKDAKIQRNYSEVQYEGKMQQSIYQPMTQRVTAKTSTNQIQKQVYARSLFKRSIQDVKIKSLDKGNKEKQRKKVEVQQVEDQNQQYVNEQRQNSQDNKLQ